MFEVWVYLVAKKEATEEMSSLYALDKKADY